VGAVDEGITVSPVFRIEEFLPAKIAGGDVGGDALKAALLGNACPDLEVFMTSRLFVFEMDLFDAGKRRGVGSETGKETVDVQGLPFDLNTDAGGSVTNPARQTIPECKLVNEGSEPHALNDTADADAGRYDSIFFPTDRHSILSA
jgi:hypothetical protein